MATLLPCDQTFMNEALLLSEKARLQAPPNPWVGCVIVRDAQIVGRGWTQPPGQAHAEVVALGEAGELANGATAYTTLEPCSHHGRTSPCVTALIQAGVTRVVVGIEDPDIQVAGNGIRLLKEAGIDVDLGLCHDAISLSLRPYLHHRRTGQAYGLIKSAFSLDGRTAAADGTSQWITGAAARADAHRVRSESQAVAVGSGTAIADQPRLTVRDVAPPFQAPIRVLFDSCGRVPCTGPLFDQSLAPTLVFTTAACESDKKHEWDGLKIDWVEHDRDDLSRIFTELGQRGVLQLMIEGGPSLQGCFFKQRLCQQMLVYMGAKILGENGLPALLGTGIHTLSEAIQLNLNSAKHLGQDVRLDYDIVY